MSDLPDPAATTEKSARDLVAGDIVVVGDGLAEVLQEPFLGSRGASLFDALELFWRARVRRLDGGGDVGYATWPAVARVVTVQRGRELHAEG